MAEITGEFEVNAGEVLGLDNEWTLLTEGGSITVHGGGTAKNITLSNHTFLTVEFDDEYFLYSLADGVDLTQGILNLMGGNAYNVKWVPFESNGLICFLSSESRLTFSSDVSGVYNGREHWSKDGIYSELFNHAESLSGLTLESVYNPDESGYCDTVYVMAGGTLSDSDVISGNVLVYDRGIARGIVLGGPNDVGHISVFGGTLENITSKCGEINIGLSSSKAKNIVISSYDEFCSTEMSTCQGCVVEGLTVTSGSRLHVYTQDDFGGEIRDVTIAENGEAVFFSQKVTNLLMTGHAIVEVTEGVLSGSITVTPSDPNGGSWCTLTDSILQFDVSSLIPGQADPLVNNLSWIEMGSNVSYLLTVSDMQKNGIYKLAGGADNFDQVIIIMNPASGLGDTLTVGETVSLGGPDYTLNLNDDLLTLTVSGGAPVGMAGDLNMDGRADIVMTIDQGGHQADGSTGAWLIQENQTAAWGDLSTRGSGWVIFGTGKTAAAKNTDDVYIKSKDNIVGAWTTDDGGKVNGWATIGEFDSDTQIVGLGDFNGNWQTDLLLRNNNGAVGCYFTGGEKTGWNYFQSLGDEWQLSAVGDLNGDGRDDVVLKHNAGFAGSWLTQSDGTMAWADLDTLPDGFEIVGAGDFNGDGTDDVLLKNGNYYGAWLVNNGNAAGWFGLGDLGDVTVEQIADFNGDGKDDLRIRTAAGDLGAQLVMGADTLDWKYYGSVGAEWSTSLAALS
ncbi:MAG: VCBS repeat-containing protein [Lentisphaeria bacterium]|nr:VCBS repeat-containing protein [Lentisphaeria bacterium]